MEDKKASKSRQKKQEIISKLSEKIAGAKALVFVNYQGLTHKQLEILKKRLKALSTDFVIAKNTLLTHAVKLSTFKSQLSTLYGPTAALFVYGEITQPLKEIAKTIRELGLPSIGFGILENGVLTGEELLKLAALPPREVLLAQVAAGLKSPIYKLDIALNWNLQKLVMTLKQIENTKQPVASR